MVSKRDGLHILIAGLHIPIIMKVAGSTWGRAEATGLFDGESGPSGPIRAIDPARGRYPRHFARSLAVP